jgi:AcrR family transcriptional regulator
MHERSTRRIDSEMTPDSATKVDKRMQRGEESRRAVLGRAMQITSEEGLEGLSIGRLAADLHLSKSGVFMHFGSKEELQLATIRAARRVFSDHVTTPALAVKPGLPRLWQLSKSFFEYSATRVFAGGCFFNMVSREFNSRPGKIRDAIVDALTEWRSFRERVVEDAKQLGALRADTDAGRLAFMLHAAESAAETEALAFDDPSRYDLGREAVRALLRDSATDPAAVDALV